MNEIYRKKKDDCQGAKYRHQKKNDTPWKENAVWFLKESKL